MSAADTQPLPESSPAARLSSKSRVGVVVLLTIHALLLLGAAERVGVTFDEPYHLVGGLAALTTGDYRLAACSSVADRWAALPLLAADDLDVSEAGRAAWTRAEAHHAAFNVFGGRDDRLRLFRLGRWMIGLLSLALGLLVLRIALVLHGEAGAMLALAFYTFSPTVLAHAGLVTVDLAAALTLLAATWTTWRILDGITAPRLLAGCLAVALAFLTKPSAVALLPIAAVLILLRLLRQEPIRLSLGSWQPAMSWGRGLAALAGVALVHGAVALLAVWAFYGFRAEATSDPLARAAWESILARSLEDSGTLGAVLAPMEKAGLLPEAFVQAYAYVGQHGERPSFLLGEFSTGGRLLFFPYLFLVKSALGLLLALGVAAGTILQGLKLRQARGGLARAAPVWTLLLVYGGMSLAAGLSIGHRHLLPIYPALFILAGAGAAWRRHPKRWLRFLPLLPIALLAAESLLSWPQHLGFFNRLHGGSGQAWRHVSDSSLDWGQDLPRLSEWLEAREGEGPVYLSYFGTDDPWLRGIDATELYSYHPWSYRHGRARGFLLEPGLYVISATMYRGTVTDPWPPWTPEAEEEYRRLRAIVDPAFAGNTPPERVSALTSDAAWRERYLDLHQRRFVRLCRWLHANRPEPDELATPSYLAWRLSEGDIRAALFGEPPWDDHGE